MKPIFITGIERSGTTIVAKIIAHCGAFSGRCTKMMENKAVKHMMDYHYQDSGWDSRGQFPLPVQDNLMIPAGWRQQVLRLLEKEGLREDGVFMLKSNRIAQTWRIWAHAFPEAQWIIVRRRTGDIIKSCQRTDYMDTFSDPVKQKAVNATTEIEGWLWWVHYHEQQFVDMITEGLDVKVIWPQRMVHGDYGQVYEMQRWLGLVWKKDILNEIENIMYKGRLKQYES